MIVLTNCDGLVSLTVVTTHLCQHYTIFSTKELLSTFLIIINAINTSCTRAHEVPLFLYHQQSPLFLFCAILYFCGKQIATQRLKSHEIAPRKEFRDLIVSVSKDKVLYIVSFLCSLFSVPACNVVFVAYVLREEPSYRPCHPVILTNKK